MFLVAFILFILFVTCLNHFSYSLNKSIANKSATPINLNLPSNLSRVEIVLKNESANDNSSSATQLYGLVTTSLGGGLAIGGSIVATYLTNYYAKKKQTKEEKRFNSSIRKLVQSELENYLNFIDSFEDNDVLTQEDVGTFVTFPKEYTKMSLERRATVFTPQALSSIERAYNFFEIYISFVKHAFADKSAKIPFKDLDELVGIDTLKKSLKDAIEAVKKDEEKKV
jgi:hypothetical protein